LITLRTCSIYRENPIMSERPDERLPEPKMDAANLYREEIFTDRNAGIIRMLAPVKSDGTPDPTRKTVYMGEAQMYTSMGALPLSFELAGNSLTEAVAAYAPAAKLAIEQAVREIQEMRRQASSSLVIPQGPMGGLGPGGGAPGGKIQLR
jgi:hypothetical protein